jgi:SAM-dependent methyltransferase
MTEQATRETAATYDRIVDDYEARATQIAPEFAAFRTDFASHVSAGGLVLDLGCGPGRDAAYFRDRGFRVAGIDASSGMAARARRNGVAVAVGDHRHPPLLAGTADGVWSSASLLHVPRPEVPPTLLAWGRLLRPGGVLGLSTSLGDSEGWEDVPYATDETDGLERRRWFVHHHRGELLRLIESAGFKILSVEERTSHRRWLQVLAEAEFDPLRAP